QPRSEPGRARGPARPAVPGHRRGQARERLAAQGLAGLLHGCRAVIGGAGWHPILKGDICSPAPPSAPAAILRSRSYVGLLLLAAMLGVPISAAAYGYLALVGKLQHWVFTDLPEGLGFAGAPLWWPLPLLAMAGLLVGLTIRHLPGNGGHSPADGFKTGGVASPVELPGIALAALATLSLGRVLGPAGPMIALGRRL